MVAEVGEAAVTERAPDGSVVLRLGVWNPDVLRSWVLGLGDHAEIIGPPAARAATVAWLSATGSGASRLGVAAGAAGAVGRGGRGSGFGPGRRHAGRRHGDRRRRLGCRPGYGLGTGRVAQVPPASARLRRLLAVVAWLAQVGEATIDEVSERFSIPPDEVVRELELAACCGVPPYTPGRAAWRSCSHRTPCTPSCPRSWPGPGA